MKSHVERRLLMKIYHSAKCVEIKATRRRAGAVDSDDMSFLSERSSLFDWSWRDALAPRPCVYRRTRSLSSLSTGEGRSLVLVRMGKGSVTQTLDCLLQ